MIFNLNIGTTQNLNEAIKELQDELTTLQQKTKTLEQVIIILRALQAKTIIFLKNDPTEHPEEKRQPHDP